MEELLKLIENRNKAWEAAKAFIEEKKDKDGLLSEEDAKIYDEMEQKVKNYSVQIERLQAMEALENQLNLPTATPLLNKPEAPAEPPKEGRASNEYKEGLLTALRTNFREVSNVLRVGSDVDGGYLVPEEMDSRLIQSLEENNIMRTLATKITTSGDHKINIATTKPAASWIEEGGALEFGDAKFEQKLLDAHKLHVAIKVTEELLYDNAFGLESFITDSFGKAIGNAEEDAFLNGDGVGKPMGIFDETNGGECVTTMDDVNSFGISLTTDRLINLVYSLKRPYRKKAAFIMSDRYIAQIRKMKDENDQYIWQPSLTAGEPDKLLGYPVYTSQYAPDNAIAFGDYSYYNIGDRGTRSFKQLSELFAANGIVGFVAKERVDGLLVLREAVQILHFADDPITFGLNDASISTMSLDGGDIPVATMSLNAGDTTEGVTEETKTTAKKK